MSNDYSPHAEGVDDPRDHPSFDDVLRGCLDELRSTGFIDPDEIIANHPRLGPAVVEDLETYVQLDPDLRPQTQSLGTLGDYTLRRQIGRGGMGVVYEAWQGSLDRRVALKVLPPGVAADTRSATRFLREAQIAARLTQANIVPVYASGVEGVTPYYAMEFVEGETLAQLLKRTANLAPEATTPFGRKDCASYFEVLARAFADVADGLQHAHSKGVIHRDIKPSNLILDTEKRLRILDFGLATLEGQESLTISGDVVGTPLYMSPEQARRTRTSIDSRTDIYSLGATMYEVICGRPPFRGKDHAETLSQIIDRDPPDPCRVNRRVPKDLETVVLKCLRKDPADRYGTAEAVAQDLRRFARADPVEARPQLAGARAMRWLKRHRARVLVGAIACVLLATAGALELARRGARYEKDLAAYEPAVRAAAAKIFASELTLQASGERSSSFTAFGRVKSKMPVAADDLESLLGGEIPRPVEEAARELEAIVEHLPGKRDALYHLARAYALLERKEAAREALTWTLRIDPDFVPAEALALEISGQEPKDVNAALDRLVSKYESTDLWQKWWLLAYKPRRVSEQARAHAELLALREVGLEPFIGFAIDLFMKQGQALLRKSDYEGAQAAFVAARTVSPGSVEPTLFLAKTYLASGDKERGESLLQGLLTRVPDERKREIALWVTALYNSIADYGGALDWVDRIGDERVVGHLRVYFLLRGGRTEEAVRAGRELAGDSRDPVARYVLAQALFERLGALSPTERVEKLSEVAEVLKRALEIDGDFQAARRLLEIAEEERDQTISCGRTLITAFEPAVAGGASEAKTREGFFGDVRRMDEVSSPFVDWYACPSPDRLELFITRNRGGWGSEARIWVARRSRVEERFGEPTIVPELVPAGGGWGQSLWSMSPDGLTIYFDSDFDYKAGAVRGDSDVYMATRPDLSSPFGGPTRLPGGVNSELHDFFPSLTADGLEIYFTRQGGGHPRRTYVATRTHPDEPFGEAVLVSKDEIPFEEEGTRVTPDGLTIFLRGDGPDKGDQFMATRSRRWDENGDRVPFGNVVNLGWPVNNPLVHRTCNTAVSIDASWPAPGSKIYFGRQNPDVSDCDLYEATWYPVGPVFRRGDSNDDGAVTIADAQYLLSFLFLGGPKPACEEASDANDEGAVDIADAEYLLNFLFLGGQKPAAPYPDCGPDSGAETLGCESSACE